MIDLKTRLSLAADAWCVAHADEEGSPAPASRLARAAGYDDGDFFERLPNTRRGPSTNTLERFARFLADPVNWPEGKVADEAKGLAHVVGVPCSSNAPLHETGVTAPAASLSAGQSVDASSEQEQAA